MPYRTASPVYCRRGKAISPSRYSSPQFLQTREGTTFTTSVIPRLGVNPGCMLQCQILMQVIAHVPTNGNFIPRYARCSRVVPDTCDGDLVVGGSDDGPGNARFNVRALASLLPSKLKASGEEYFFENRPVYRRYSWHLWSDSDNCRASFNGYPRRTHPTSSPKFIAAFLKNVL
jgi:hypothetical protein